MSVGIVLVAGGRGRRFGPSSRPKQFRPLGGRPAMDWPLRTFERTALVKHVAVVVPKEYVAATARRLKRFKKVGAVAAGGATRAESVRAGVRALPPSADVILVHDAARVLVTPAVIERVAKAVKRSGAALAAWPVPDTLKEAAVRGKKVFVRRTVPRAGMWQAQTPQGFRRDRLNKLLEAPLDLTDDVQVFERRGESVEIVLGDARNFKVTVKEDFDLCARLI